MLCQRLVKNKLPREPMKVGAKTHICLN